MKPPLLCQNRKHKLTSVEACSEYHEREDCTASPLASNTDFTLTTLEFFQSHSNMSNTMICNSTNDVN